MSLLLNGGFELGNDGGWNIDQDPNSDIVEDSSNAYSGNCYLRTYCTGEWNGTVQNITKNIIPGNSYFIEAAIKSNSISGSLANGPGIRIRFYDAGDNALLTDNFYNLMGTTSWVYFSQTYTVPDNSARIELLTYCQSGATSGSAWYDNIRVIDTTVTTRPTTDSIVLHMPLDDGRRASKIKDLSLTGNHGNPVALNTSSAWDDGNVRQSAVFDGSTIRYVQVPYHSSLAPTSAMSFGCWAYKDNWNVSTSSQSLVSNYQSGGYTITVYNGYAYVMAYIDGTMRYAAKSHTNLSAGWHHFFATFDGQILSLYIDGASAGTYDNGSAGSITYSYDNSLLIGADAYAADVPYEPSPWLFDGRIDEVRIYNSCLTAGEVATLYNYPGNYACLSTFNAEASWWILAKAHQDIAWDILSSSEFDLAWKILSATNPVIGWKIFNIIDEETAWKLLAASDSETAWKIINRKERIVAWSIIYQAVAYRMFDWRIFNRSDNGVAWKILSSSNETLSWKALADKEQSFAWKLLNSGAGLQNIAWKILNEKDLSANWRILRAFDDTLGWKISNVSNRNIAWVIQNRGVLGQNLSWKILATEVPDFVWKILNSTKNTSSWQVFTASDQQAAWSIINAANQNNSWTIFNEASKGVSWRILMAALPVPLAEFIISNAAPFSFDLDSKSTVAFNLNSKSIITFNIK